MPRRSTRASTSSAPSPTSAGPSTSSTPADRERGVDPGGPMSISLPHLYRGKVRDLYDAGDDRILMVASDRVSVFDVVLPDDIPDKGRVLTALSYFWFEQTQGIVANHVISCDPTDFPPMAGDVAGRATLVRSTQPIRLECV